MSPSSRGLGHCPFTAATGVRIPLGTPFKPILVGRFHRLVGILALNRNGIERRCYKVIGIRREIVDDIGRYAWIVDAN